jgi:hypothetical protein
LLVVGWLLLLFTVRTPCPNPRIIKNLCTYLCTIRPKGLWAAEDSEEAGRERKAKEETEGSDAARAQAAAEEQENLVKSRGATFALVACAEYFQETLFQGLPWLWELMCLPLKQVHDTTDPSQVRPANLSAYSFCEIPHLFSHRVVFVSRRVSHVRLRSRQRRSTC